MKKILYLSFEPKQIDNFKKFLNTLNLKKIDPVFVILSSNKQSIIVDYLKENKYKVYKLNYKNKKDIPKSIIKLFFILKKEKIDIIQTDLVEPSIIALTAGYLAKVKQRIYIRNHSTSHHLYSKKGVLYDKYCNLLATDIVAISKTVKDVLINLENVPEKKITLIHNAIDLNKFYNVSEEQINKIKNKYNLNNHYPIIGVISRFIELKGIQYIIPAFKRLLSDYPNSVLILANAIGAYKGKILSLLSELPKDSYRIIEFELDIAALYKTFDIFVHVPINKNVEAFGFVYIEALASEIPSIFTLSGIANDIIKDRYNALIVDYKNTDDIYEKMQEMLKNEKLRKQIIINGQKSLNSFSIIERAKKFEKLYGL